MTAGSGSGQLRSVDAATQAHGLVIYRASRLEALLPPLQQLLAATPPRHVLAPHTLIAAHPGMRQWLTGALARGSGPDGIAANLDILLPSSWIDRLAQQQLGQQAVALPGYQRQHLRWTIHAALIGAVPVPGVTDVRIAAYLATQADAAAGSAAEAARRRFQLADRLAGVFSQYLVYRPDWLRSWEQGRFHAATRGTADAVALSTEQHLLGPLWRHVRTRLGPHRGDIVADLILGLGRDQPSPTSGEALHVFGVSHLAPSELAVLRAFAQQHLVALYVPDPCREYWGGLARELPVLRAQRREEEARIDQAAGSDYWVEQTHPLLASWGRMGQHFIMALADSEGDVLEDVRHWRDTQTEPAQDRLSRVQQSIRQLQPQLMVVDLSDKTVAAAERADASLRVHSCHTRLRELEVLRDQLLEALATPGPDGASVKPSDIVVMAPDIQAYVPLIPAVFGAPGDARERLPYHLADVSVARSHGLFTAFRRWLDLPGTRITAPQIVDLLAIPEVARRLHLDAQGMDDLTQWLRESRVAWALDGAFRERFGVPPIAEHTFGWAMERMLGGYLMAGATTADRQPGVALPDGTELAPLTTIHGPAASNLGALDQLLGELQSLCDLAGKALPASAWAPALERHFESLFRIDPMDRAARDAQTLLLRFIRGIASEPAAAGEDPLLHFAVVRDLLVARLSAAPERQRFLMGGMTFCGMVPQRAIPFKVVAVLGLNDGEFPRAVSDGGLDLMTRFRRLGDRDVRTDDRYLFLETLMSARTRLHLSYIGQGVRDGQPRNPAAPLAELLTALDTACGVRADDDHADRPWRVRHPLQPFDQRYFDAADSRLFSYNALFAGMHGRGDQPDVAPFLDRTNAAAIEIGPMIALRELHAYYRDPAKQVLEQRMQISLDALEDERLPKDEPIEAKFSALDTVVQKLFFNDALPGWPHATWPPAQAPDWLRLGGVMPPGRAGEQAWQQESGVVELLLEQVARVSGFEHGAPAGASCEIDVAIDTHRVTGQIAHVFRADVDGAEHWQLLRVFGGKGGKLKKEAELGFRERVPMFLDWALLRLHSARSGGTIPAVRLCPLLDGEERRWVRGINRWDEVFLQGDVTQRMAMCGELAQRVRQLLDWWSEAQSSPRWYFPKSSWAAISNRIYPKTRAGKSSAADGIDEPAQLSIGSSWIADHGGVGERDYAPGYSHLLAGDVDFAEGSAELAALAEFAMALHRSISFEAAGEMAA